MRLRAEIDGDELHVTSEDGSSDDLKELLEWIQGANDPDFEIESRLDGGQSPSLHLLRRRLWQSLEGQPRLTIDPE